MYKFLALSILFAISAVAGRPAIRVPGNGSFILVGSGGYDIPALAPASAEEAAGGIELLWLKLDDNTTSSTLVDSSTNQFSIASLSGSSGVGTVQASARSTDDSKFGRALALQGESAADYVDFSSDYMCYKLSGAATYTIAWWGKTSGGSHSDWLVFRSFATEGEVYSYWNNGYSTLKWYFFTPYSLPSIETENYFTWTGWGHWVYVKGASATKLYFNGSLIDEVSGTGGPDALAELRFGSGPDTQTHGYSAVKYIDDFRVYDRELTAEDIAWLYNSGAGTDRPLVSSVSPKSGEPTYVTVYFNANGGAGVPDSVVRATDRSYGLLPTPEAPSGQEFLRWDRTPDDGQTWEVVSGQVLDVYDFDHTLMAVYGTAEVPIFVAYWGPHSAETVYFTDWFGNPYYPTYDGNTTWSSANNLQCVNLYINLESGGGYPVTENLPALSTVNWYVPPEYCTIYFDATGGNVDPTSAAGIVGASYMSLAWSVAYVYYDGYMFNGWYSSYLGMQVCDAYGNWVDIPISGNDTLYAQWQ